MKKFNYIFLTFVVSICAYVGITASGYPKQDLSVGYGPGFYPLLLIALILFLCAILLLQTIFGKKVATETVKSMDWNTTLKKPTIFLGIMIMFTILLRIVGLWIDVFLFLVSAMLMMELSIKKAVLPAAITATVIYVIFVVMLKVPFPSGILFGG